MTVGRTPPHSLTPKTLFPSILPPPPLPLSFSLLNTDAPVYHTLGSGLAKKQQQKTTKKQQNIHVFMLHSFEGGGAKQVLVLL